MSGCYFNRIPLGWISVSLSYILLLILNVTLECVEGRMCLQAHPALDYTAYTNAWKKYHKTALLCLYRARNKISQLSIPTHAQLQRHRLKFIKNHLKNSYMFRSTTIFREFVLAKITIIMTTVGCFYAKSGDVAACRVVCIGLYLMSAWVSVSESSTA